MNVDIIKKFKYSLILFDELLKCDINCNNNKILNNLSNDNNFKNIFYDLIFKWKCEWFKNKEETISKKLPFYNINYTSFDKKFFIKVIL